MLFFFAKIFDAVGRPSEILLLLSLVGIVLCAFSRPRWGLRALYLGMGGFLLIAVLPIDRWMIAPLENRFPQVTAPPAHVDGIVVLGGAMDTERTLDHGIPALNWAAERMTEFADLARRYPDARLVFTGGSASLIPNGLTEADVARQLFTGLGVDQKRMVYESASRTTFENAELTHRLVDPKPGQVWILITSANHMPRAIGVFRRVGWDMLAWPVAFKTPAADTLPALTPFPDHLSIVDLAFHEWVGLLAYYLTDRSRELFPGP